MDTKKHVGFDLIQINTEQFAIINEYFNEGNEVSFQPFLRFGVDKEKKIIAVLAKFHFLQKEIPFIIIEASCHFLFHHKSWEEFFSIEKDEITLPKEIAQNLSVITIGTVRGILHNKTENTNFNKMIIPLVNVIEIIKEDIILK